MCERQKIVKKKKSRWTPEKKDRSAGKWQAASTEGGCSLDDRERKETASRRVIFNHKWEKKRSGRDKNDKGVSEFNKQQQERIFWQRYIAYIAKLK